MKLLTTTQEAQLSVLEKVLHEKDSQNWRGLVDVECGQPMGRGVLTTKPFKQGDVVIDYHGTEVPLGRGNPSFNAYVAVDPKKRNSNYILEVKTNPRRLIDASHDPCVLHPGRRCLGRLINHADEKLPRGGTNKNCNLKFVDVALNFLGESRIVVLVATRNIDIGEQLFFDYGDRDAREAFQ